MYSINEELDEFASYIEVTYIRRKRACDRRPAIPPKFPPKMWNVYDLVLNNRLRTNNVVEGLHSKLGKLLATHDANIWKFFDNIKNNQQDTEITVIRLREGHIRYRPQPSKTIVIQRRVEHVIRNYNNYKENDEITIYLRRV